MLFMVIERFKNRDAKAVYRRFRDRGRGAPEGLEYVGSWIEANFDRCFQLMECNDARLLQAVGGRVERSDRLRDRAGRSVSRDARGRRAAIVACSAEQVFGDQPDVREGKTLERLSPIERLHGTVAMTHRLAVDLDPLIREVAEP